MCNCHNSQPQSQHWMNEAFENVQLHRRCLEGAAMIKMCLTSIFVELSIKTQAANVLLRWTKSARKFYFPDAFLSFCSEFTLLFEWIAQFFFLNFMLNIWIWNWFSEYLRSICEITSFRLFEFSEWFSIRLVSRIRFDKKLKWSDKKYFS